jgi:hypothetical protein
VTIHSSQQFGIPAGRAAALPADPEPEEAPVPLAEPLEPVMPLVELPVVVPDDDPLAPFLSRAMLALTSQHWFEAEVAPEPELVPVPCALAKPATPNSAAAETAARQSFFMDISSFDQPASCRRCSMQRIKLRSRSSFAR